MPRIIATLSDVTCWNTEDIHGADEFYIVGSIIAAGGQQKIVKPILTRPISINDNQTIPFGLPNFVFDANVPDTWYLRFPLIALDEDSSKDWSKIEQAYKAILDAVESTLAYAVPVAPGILNSVKWFVRQDQDDILGYHPEQWYPVRSFPYGWYLMNWPISGGSNYYSNWNYLVRLWVGKW